MALAGPAAPDSYFLALSVCPAQVRVTIQVEAGPESGKPVASPGSSTSQFPGCGKS
jgi:hypothetical protein